MSARATAYILGLDVCPNGEVITRTEKMVGVSLADSHQERKAGSRTFPAVETIAQVAMVSVRTCQRLLDSLERKGVIQRVRPKNQGRGAVTFYYFSELDENPEGCHGVTLSEPLLFGQKGDKRVTEGCHKGDIDGIASSNKEQKQQRQQKQTPPNPLAGEGEGARREIADDGKEKGSAAHLAQRGISRSEIQPGEGPSVEGCAVETALAALTAEQLAHVEQMRAANRRADAAMWEGFYVEQNLKDASVDGSEKESAALEVAAGAVSAGEGNGAAADAAGVDPAAASGADCALSEEQAAHVRRLRAENRPAVAWDWECWYREQNVQCAAAAEEKRVAAEGVEELKRALPDEQTAARWVMDECGLLDDGRKRGLGAVIRAVIVLERARGKPPWETAPAMVEAWREYDRVAGMLAVQYGPLKFFRLGVWSRRESWRIDERRGERRGASVGSYAPGVQA